MSLILPYYHGIIMLHTLTCEAYVLRWIELAGCFFSKHLFADIIKKAGSKDPAIYN